MIWQILASAVNGALVIILALILLGTSLAVLYGFIFSPLAVVGVHLSSIPLKERGDSLYWRDRKIINDAEAEMAVGSLILALSVAIGVLAVIGYISEIAGVVFV